MLAVTTSFYSLCVKFSNNSEHFEDIVDKYSDPLFKEIIVISGNTADVQRVAVICNSDNFDTQQLL